jgi:hypothetical protein
VNSPPEGWHRLSAYCIRSDDRAYTICGVGRKFELWRGGEQLFVNLDSLSDALENHSIVSRETKSVAA